MKKYCICCDKLKNETTFRKIKNDNRKEYCRLCYKTYGIKVINSIIY